MSPARAAYTQRPEERGHDETVDVLVRRAAGRNADDATC